MSYPEACRAMTSAITEREGALDALSLAYYHGKGAVTIHRHLMAVLDSHHRFQQARAEVLGMTIPQGMKETAAS